jgi:hypothetical protein
LLGRGSRRGRGCRSRSFGYGSRLRFGCRFGLRGCGRFGFGFGFGFCDRFLGGLFGRLGVFCRSGVATLEMRLGTGPPFRLFGMGRAFDRSLPSGLSAALGNGR